MKFPKRKLIVLICCLGVASFLPGPELPSPERGTAWHDLPPPRFDIPPYAEYLKGYKICLDPGHGGEHANRGPRGLTEDEVNLRVALYLREFLAECGAEVIMTREEDKRVGLKERDKIANENKSDFFVSIHHNATSDPDTNFTSTWYHRTPDYSPASLDLARYIQEGVREALRLRMVPPTGLYSDQLMYKRGGFAVLRRLEMPGVLCEASFHTNRQEEKRLADPRYNKREAYGYFLGIARYLAAGVPRTELLRPKPGSTIRDLRPSVRIKVYDGLSERGIWGGDRIQIFSDSIIVRLDGKKVAHKYDAKSGVISFRPARALSNGEHRIEVMLQNLYKNHNLPQVHRFHIKK